MALVKNSFEAGVAAGTLVDATNPGTPDAFNHFSTTLAVYNSLSYAGLLSAKADTPSQYFGWTGIAGASTTGGAAFRTYVYVNNTTPNSMPIFSFRSTGGGTGLWSLLHNSNGTLYINSDSGGNAGTTTGALPLNQWVRIEVGFTNPTTTTGTLTLRCYLGDSTTPISGLSLDLTNVAMFASACGTVRIGRSHNITGNYTIYYDQVAFQTGSNALIGPAAQPPVADFSMDKTFGPSPLTIQFTDESTNNPTSWLWHFSDGITSTLQNPTHTFYYEGDGTGTSSHSAYLEATNDAGTGVSPSYPIAVEPPPVSWSLWNGTTESPLTLNGVWNGTSIVPASPELSP